MILTLCIKIVANVSDLAVNGKATKVLIILDFEIAGIAYFLFKTGLYQSILLYAKTNLLSLGFSIVHKCSPPLGGLRNRTKVDMGSAFWTSRKHGLDL